jgi:DNA-binding NtrC family response regulator
MNAMPHTVNMSAKEPDHTQHAYRHPYTLRDAVADFERKHIRNILELTGWDRLAAAEMLGVPFEMLLAKIDHYQLLEYWVSASP